MNALILILLLYALPMTSELEHQLELCRKAVEGAESEGEYDPTSCRKAAELGSPRANYTMGMYYDRTGEREKSIEHYQAAADGGLVWGHIGLGHHNIVRDPEAAEKHYRIVAESNDETSIVALAFIGDLRVRSGHLSKAYSWFYACAHFDTYARSFCESRMERQRKNLTNKQIERAIDQAQPIIDWLSGNKTLNSAAGKAGAG